MKKTIVSLIHIYIYIYSVLRLIRSKTYEKVCNRKTITLKVLSTKLQLFHTKKFCTVHAVSITYLLFISYMNHLIYRFTNSVVCVLMQSR